MRNRENPYSPATTSRIQVGYYGHALRTNEKWDPQRFAYPAHVVVLLSPLALFSFETAQVVFVIVLILAMLGAILMWLRIQQMPNTNLTAGVAAVLYIASWPAVQGLHAQQVTLLVAGILAGAFYCASRSLLRTAGVLLTFCTMKPQLSSLAIAWLLVWSLSDSSRRRLVWWFAGSMIISLLATELLVPGWLLDWGYGLRDYMSYTGSRLNLQVVFGQIAGGFITLVVSFGCAVLLWRARVCDAASEQFRFTVALVAALTLFVLPTWSWASYNQVLLAPAVIYIWRKWRDPRLSRTQVRLVHRVFFLTIGWSYVATLYLTVAHLLGAEVKGDSQLWPPIYMFFLVAPFTLLTLYLLRPKVDWPAARPGGSAAAYSARISGTIGHL